MSKEFPGVPVQAPELFDVQMAQNEKIFASVKLSLRQWGWVMTAIEIFIERNSQDEESWLATVKAEIERQLEACEVER